MKAVTNKERQELTSIILELAATYNIHPEIVKYTLMPERLDAAILANRKRIAVGHKFAVEWGRALARQIDQQGIDIICGKEKEC